MKEIEDTYIEERGLHAAAIFYSLVLMAALLVGMYGLFSLFWLATSAAEHSAQALRLIA